MRVVRINEAEAIIEPFWTGDKNADNSTYDAFEGYDIRILPGAKASYSASAWFTIEKSPAGKPAFTMSRRCSADVGEYDISRLFACVPKHMEIRIHAGFGGGAEELILTAKGTDNFSEFDGRLPGKILTSLRIEMVPLEQKPAIIELVWLGVANRRLEKIMEARPSPYTPDWPGLLVEKPKSVEPQLKLYFDNAGAEALRKRLNRTPFKRMLDSLRAQTDKDMATFKPEAAVGEFLPDPFQSVFVRERDRWKPAMHDGMGRLAFIGLIDRDPEKSRMAVRMALSAAHCREWTQGVLSVLPGSPYHRRGYVEAWYCKGMALVLDLAGSFLTPYGRETLRDVLIRKAIAHIESDLFRWEYVWGMNQGLMFNHGRIMALLSVYQTYPRYRPRLEEAERDQHTMLGNYIRDDGGTLEGMGYWEAALDVGLPPLCAMARYHGKALEKYVTPTIRRTGDFALDMLTIQDDGGIPRYMSINSCRSQSRISPFIAAFFARVSGNPRWQEIYRKIVEEHGDSDPFSLIISSDLKPRTASVPPSPRLGVYPDTGQVTRIRDVEGVGPVHFHFCTGPGRGGHTHEDKGSFIIETDKEALAIDRGMLHYDHPEHTLLVWTGRHNLLCPEDNDGAPFRQHPSTTDGGILTSAIEKNGIFLLASDNTGVWAPSPVTKSVRRVISPLPSLYIFDDELVMKSQHAASFRISTTKPVEKRNAEFWIIGKHAALRVVPLNWKPSEATMDQDGMDDLERPAKILRLLSGKSATHRLLTAVEILLPGAKPSWKLTTGNAPRAESEKMELTIKPAAAPLISITSNGKRTECLRAICKNGRWRIQ